jgi:hypothetical protein
MLGNGEASLASHRSAKPQPSVEEFVTASMRFTALGK